MMTHALPLVIIALALPAAHSLSAVTTYKYQCQGFTCAARHKPAASGHEADPPLLLVHPVGIGLDSWFWNRLLDNWQGAEVYCPDFIGCGKSEEWAPEEKGLFVPLDWVRQCEVLWRERIQRPCMVVGQGGMAPVAVQLATRQSDLWDGPRAVCSVVLASPPTWDDMADGLDEAEVARNYRQLSSPLGAAGYRLLRMRSFVRFFSDLFLFQGQCDDAWLDECDRGAAPLAARFPVFAFNAGLVGVRGLGAEMRAMKQPMLILNGEADKRTAKRAGYAEQMAACSLQTLPGCNVLPWEEPQATARALAAFARELPREAEPP